MRTLLEGEPVVFVPVPTRHWQHHSEPAVDYESCCSGFCRMAILHGQPPKLQPQVASLFACIVPLLLNLQNLPAPGPIYCPSLQRCSHPQGQDVDARLSMTKHGIDKVAAAQSHRTVENAIVYGQVFHRDAAHGAARRARNPTATTACRHKDNVALRRPALQTLSAECVPTRQHDWHPRLVLPVALLAQLAGKCDAPPRRSRAGWKPRAGVRYVRHQQAGRRGCGGLRLCVPGCSC